MSAGTPGGGVRSASGRLPVREVSGSRVREHEDELAGEEPMEIRVVPGSEPQRRGVPIAVTMRTPGDDFELAAGFLYSEGVLRSRRDFFQISYCTEPEEDQLFNIVNVWLRPGVHFDATRLSRSTLTTSSCGICGRGSIESVRQRAAAQPAGRFSLPWTVLRELPDRARALQTVFARTGGLHAAALFDAEGRPLLVREDVGRHNAVDKLVGNQLQQDALPASARVLLVSGRASFELVQKAALAGIPFLAAIGAPSTLAVETARSFGMTLVGFLRSDRCNVYSGPERVGPAEAPHGAAVG
jgi:FdhD protein